MKTHLHLLLTQNKLLHSAMLCWLAALGTIVLVVPKGEEVLWCLNHHRPVTDAAFGIATKLGEGPFIVFMMVATAIALNKRKALVIGLAMGAVFLIMPLFKQVFFEHADRPAALFQSMELQRQVGWTLFRHQSFPSGHTTAAFTIFPLFAFLFPHRWLGLICFLLAALTGLSRIYLLQHFALDVLAGSLLGYTIAAAAFLISNKNNHVRNHEP